MIRIKTHTPIFRDRRYVKVSEDYVCEIIYSYPQLNPYRILTLDDSWEATYDETYYNTELTANDSHYLVFRSNNMEGVSERGRYLKVDFTYEGVADDVYMVKVAQSTDIKHGSQLFFTDNTQKKVFNGIVTKKSSDGTILWVKIDTDEELELAEYTMTREMTNTDKKVTSDYPFNTYGRSLLLVEQKNIDGTYVNGITRWNSGKECSVSNLSDDEKYYGYEKLKEMTGLTDAVFKKIFGIWRETSINLNKNSFDLEIPIASTNGYNLLQEDHLMKDYGPKIAEKSINPIVDYEKKQFVFSYITKSEGGNKESSNDCVIRWDFVDNYYIMRGDRKSELKNRDDVIRLANSLRFDIYLRERDSERYEAESVNNQLKYYQDFGDWETDDSKYWFNKAVKDGDMTELNKTHGDYLGNLTFTDEDVYYQRNNIKKTFLRLSVYDSPYRQRQSLLYYSTLFFDTNVLYNNFVKTFTANKYDGTEDAKEQFVFKDNSLSASFMCTNKYNQSASSDGFYLYLFENVVKGNEFTTLYLKVELNDAKTGKTVPLLWPGEKPTETKEYIMKDGVKREFVLKSELERCPLYYGDEAKTDIEALLHDLYIPIGVKYNYDTGEYIWFIIADMRKNICPDDDGNIILKLFEPRINKTSNDN